MAFSPATWTNTVWTETDFNAVRDLVREVGPVKTQHVFDAVMDTSTATTFAAGSAGTTHSPPYRMKRESTGTQNSEVGWYVTLVAGTYQGSIVHRNGSDRGIYSFQLDGTEYGTVDGFASSGNAWAADRTDTFTVPAAGEYLFTVKMADKHFQSTSYVGEFAQIMLDLIEPAYPCEWTVPVTWANGDIESAAVWERQIRNNLLAAGTRQRWTVIDPWAGWVSANTNWSTQTTNANDLPTQLSWTSSGAQNALVDLLVALPAGTCTLKFWHYRGSDRGIFTVYLDGVSQGTVDSHNATQDGQLSSVTLTVATTDVHTLEFKMATKNASSSSYKGYLGRCYIEQTATTTAWTAPAHWSVRQLVAASDLNTQIRDNLKNRGPGQWAIPIDPQGASVSETSWQATTTPYDGTSPYNAKNTTEGGSEARGYRRRVLVPLTAGTWELNVWCAEGANKGIITAYLDVIGTDTAVTGGSGRTIFAPTHVETTGVATFDAYNASNQDTKFQQGSISVSTTNWYWLTLAVEGKHASSTGWEEQLYHTWLRRTA